VAAAAGKMLLVDLEQGRIVDDDELKRTLATQKTLSAVDRRAAGVSLEDMPEPAPPVPSDVSVLDRHRHSATRRRTEGHSCADGAKRRGSGRLDGNDSALPVLSNRPKVFYNYFKQLFAQDDEPPIDPIREELVMSLQSFIGPRPNLSCRCERAADAPRVQQPVLTPENMEKAASRRAVYRCAFPLDRARHLHPAAWGANDGGGH